MEKFSKLSAFLIGSVSVGVMFPTLALAEKLPLAWQAPTQNCDGTTMPAGDLASYKIYYSKDVGRPTQEILSCGCTNPHQYDLEYTVSDPALTTIEVPVDDPGTYYVTITATDVDGNESCYSNEVVKEVNSATPDAPLNFEISLR